MGNKFTLETAVSKIVFASDFDHPDVGPSIENTGDDVMTLTGPFSFVGALETDDDVDVGGDLDVTGSTTTVDLDVLGVFTGASGSFSGALTGLSLDLSGDLAAATGSFTGDLITETDLTAANGVFSAQVEANTFLAQLDSYGTGGTVYAEGNITTEGNFIGAGIILTGDIEANTLSALKTVYDDGGTILAEGLSTLLGGVAFNENEDTLIEGSDTLISLDIAGVEVLKLETAGQTRSVSAASLNDILTNYYTGVLHNTLTFRATRGTSASPGYLVDNDVVGGLVFEARDGNGTWGQCGAVLAETVQIHTSGETGSEIVVYATETGSDARTRIAGFGMYRILPGFLDLDLNLIDARGLGPLTLGGDWLFGYAGDISATATGVSVVQWSTGAIKVMLGNTDNYIYFGSGSLNPLDTDTWRFGDDGSGNLYFSTYNVGGGSWDDLMHHDGATLVLDDTVYDDIQFNISSGRVPGANYPDWDTSFTTNTGEFKFDVNDYIDIGANEVNHGWKEGTAGHVHLHLALDGANSTGSDRFAKFTVYLAFADSGEVWAEATPLTAELTIPTGSADLTHFYLDMGDLALTNNKIGTQIKARVKRIAATGGTEYANHIFITQLGIHLENDTIGSRDEAIK